ncbi:MAG TPA: GTPase [Actinobacteria bacterium]|jgi:predicted GTPase|nr:GTPase [Actinomycetota bacterium]HCP62909.1 GTPase [Actinomycetota bacterium]
MTRRVLIMGAAGRDFHNFNVAFRDDPTVEVVAFTATQIPFIDKRRYPAELAGARYPEGIPIFLEDQLVRLIKDLGVDEVVFAYSDVAHTYVMHEASTVMAAGPSFALLGPNATMLDANTPVVAVCAVRTGSGKSQTTRKVVQTLKDHGKTAVVVRHPMPYGNLVAQRVQRFETFDDLDAANVTIEEREEYEPHLRKGTVVYAGVDYGAILEQAQKECDVLLWDGGNNDMPFFRPTVHITVVDPLRAGHEMSYHPGETNLRMADVLVINKMDSATSEQVEHVERSIASANPGAMVIKANSPVTFEEDVDLKGKRVLVIEDGPTLTHGEMQYGAGVVAAKQAGAGEIIDPREWATGSMKEIYAKYEIGPVLPAMGYSGDQLREFEHMINSSGADVVIVATPIDLRKLVNIEPQAVRVSYDLEETDGSPTIADALKPVLD